VSSASATPLRSERFRSAVTARCAVSSASGPNPIDSSSVARSTSTAGGRQREQAVTLLRLVVQLQSIDGTACVRRTPAAVEHLVDGRRDRLDALEEQLRLGQRAVGFRRVAAVDLHQPSSRPRARLPHRVRVTREQGESAAAGGERFDMAAQSVQDAEQLHLRRRPFPAGEAAGGRLKQPDRGTRPAEQEQYRSEAHTDLGLAGRGARSPGRSGRRPQMGQRSFEVP
jgi:hypothetical protein